MIEAILLDVSPSKAALGLGLVLFVIYYALKLRASRKIQSLGGKSPAIPTYLPVGESTLSLRD